MSPSTARLPLASDAPTRALRARVWRPFAKEVADIVCVEDRGGDVRPRMHPWFGISLVRAPAVVTVESRRDVLAGRNWIFLIPHFQLHGFRAQAGAQGVSQAGATGTSRCTARQTIRQAVTFSQCGTHLATVRQAW